MYASAHQALAQSIIDAFNPKVEATLNEGRRLISREIKCQSFPRMSPDIHTDSHDCSAAKALPKELSHSKGRWRIA